MHYLSQEISPLIEQRELLELVLVDSEGLVLDAAGHLYPAESLAALFAPLRRLAENMSLQMNIQCVEEISIRTQEPRLRVILQNFKVNDASYMIIALFPITTFYRQVTMDIMRIVRDCIRRLESPSSSSENPPASRTGPA